MMKKKLLFLLALMLIFMLVLTSCTSSKKDTTTEDTPAKETPAVTGTNEPVKGGNLIYGSFSEPKNLNPYILNDVPSDDVARLIFDGLVKTNNKLEAQPYLAEKIDISSDNLTYTVKIKQGVKFHDGVELTAEDVMFSYNIAKDPGYAGPRKSNFDMIESMKKIDNYTVEFKLNKIDVTFYPTTLSFGIVPKHLLEKVPVKDMGDYTAFNKKPIGTGPFKFTEWVEGQYVKVEKNPEYFDGSPYIDSITYKIVPDQNALILALQSGEIDYGAVPSTDIKKVREWVDSKNKRVEEGLDLAYTFIGYNSKNPLFADKRVRQALTTAINREDLVKFVLEGEGEVANVPESPLSWAYSNDVSKFAYAPDKAVQLLKEAGWVKGADGKLKNAKGEVFKFSLQTNAGNKAREDIISIVKDQLKELGIEVKIEAIEFQALVEKLTKTRKYDAIVIGWGLSAFPDLYEIFHSDNSSEGAFNFVFYKNPEVDALISQARQTPDKTKYKEIYASIYKKISEDQPYTFLYYPKTHSVLPKNLMGYEFVAGSEFFNPHKWWLKTN
jgi:peptide/nickel transport system substrate-binding protein